MGDDLAWDTGLKHPCSCRVEFSAEVFESRCHTYLGLCYHGGVRL